MPHEFELINKIVKGLGEGEGQSKGLILGPGDDCALTDLDSGHHLASSIDSFLPERHFPRYADAWLIAQRCVRASLSDLAAMGAKPKFALLALSIEAGTEDWVDGFTQGVRDAAMGFACLIAGGNLAKGPMQVTLSVHGDVPAGQALTRDGAKPGEDVYVSGTLGGAAKALAALGDSDRQTIRHLAQASPEHPLVRYWLPEPRLALGQGLRGLASAVIDISDGLVADAWHIARASRVALHVNTHTLPSIGDIAASDDYELLFTAPRSAASKIAALSQMLTVPVTRIGETAGDPGGSDLGGIDLGGIDLGVFIDGQPAPEYQSGYRHFSS